MKRRTMFLILLNAIWMCLLLGLLIETIKDGYGLGWFIACLLITISANLAIHGDTIRLSHKESNTQ
ncbi:unnamed protein product [marine sediment metagenome]|uniref:Uncharacterized protein n=1 Tax=marine sediment metagenome TaxID=412755 RepID=X1HR68_9ZZZZ